MNLIRDLGLDPISYQLGVLKGSGKTEEEIAQFAALMATEPSVRPKPRSQRPRHVLHYPTDLPGLSAPKTGGRPGHQPEVAR